MKKIYWIWEHQEDLSIGSNKDERIKFKYCDVSFRSESFFGIGNFMQSLLRD